MQKLIQFQIDQKVKKEAESIIDQEGFRSIPSLAYFAFMQMIKQFKETGSVLPENIPTFEMTPEIEKIIQKAEKEIKAGKTYKLDPEDMSIFSE
jgi:antitoxin component of RelBE/YafQ-DinJ toxin-antitoxin module